MIDKLFYIINKTDLQLLISSDIITWEARNQSFTVNFIFNSASLKQKIISYYININLKNDSDYYLIFTQFSLKKVSQVIKSYYNWKKMNSENIIAEAQHLQSLKNMHLLADLKNYINYLLKFINQLIKNIIFWFKLTSEYSYRWWTSEIQITIYHLRQLLDHDIISE